jgi:hypothetical protein
MKTCQILPELQRTDPCILHTLMPFFDALSRRGPNGGGARAGLSVPPSLRWGRYTEPRQLFSIGVTTCSVVRGDANMPLELRAQYGTATGRQLQFCSAPLLVASTLLYVPVVYRTRAPRRVHRMGACLPGRANNGKCSCTFVCAPNTGTRCPLANPC